MHDSRVSIVACGLALLLACAEFAGAQERNASQTQINAINAKFAALGEPRTMKVAFDPLNGDVTFQFITKERNIATGVATEQGILQFSVIAFGDPYENGAGLLKPRVISSARIEINPDATDGKTLSATAAQLDGLSQRLVADRGKVDTLKLRVDEKGNLSCEFTTGAGTKANVVIPRGGTDREENLVSIHMTNRADR